MLLHRDNVLRRQHDRVVGLNPAEFALSAQLMVVLLLLKLAIEISLAPSFTVEGTFFLFSERGDQLIVLRVVELVVGALDLLALVQLRGHVHTDVCHVLIEICQL